MHFEVPKAKSFKEFGGEYLMIVVSIVTALALEAGVQAWHHRHVAEEAAVKINQELRDDAEQIAIAQKHNVAQIRRLMAIRSDLESGIRNKVDDASLMKRITGEWLEAFNLRVASPSLRREAWEAAVASQAASWMPDEALERYSRAYAKMRDTEAIAYGPVGAMDMARYSDTMSNLAMGQGDPRELYRLINQMIIAYNGNGNMEGLRRLLIEVVDPAAGRQR